MADLPDSLGDEIRRVEQPRDSVNAQQAVARARAALLGRSTPVLLSRYVLLDCIGSGGRGVVHRAYDPTLERRVAIKLVRTDLGDEPDDSSRARLLREAQAIAQLSHPNVVAVYDVGTYDSTALMNAPATLSGVAGHEGIFVVMEYVEGPTLAQWLAQPRGWREVVEVCGAAGRGLAAAHRAGLIHRDFKPANVILGTDGRVRVLDFGLARATEAFAPQSPLTPRADPDRETARETDDAPEPDDTPPPDSGGARLATPLTREGAVLGTPLYMAPEQHRGLELDARADQYAFCVVLFEALYGQRPFTARGAKALLAEKRRGPPARQGRTAVPEHFHRLVARGLAPLPNERFPSVDGLLDELMHDPTAKRRRLLAAGLGATAIATLVAGVAGFRAHRDALCDGQRAALAGVWDEPLRTAGERAFADTDRAYAGDTWRYVVRELDTYADAWVEARTRACRHDQSGTPTPATTACLDARLATMQAVTERLEHADASVVEAATDIVQLLPPVEGCVDDGGELSRDAAVASTGDLLRAESSRLLGRLDEARAVARAVIERADADGDLALRGRAVLALARASGRAPDRADMDGLYDAWSTAERAGDLRTAVLAATDIMMEVGLQQFRFDDAAGLAKVVRGMLERPPRDPLLEAAFTQQLAELHFASGSIEAGLEQAERALALVQEQVGSSHPRLIAPLELIGRVLRATGRLDGSRDAYTRALQIVGDALGPHHPAAIPLLEGLSRVDELQGDLAAAFDRASTCLSVAERAHGSTHPRVATCADCLASVYQARGEPERAIEWLERAVSIERSVHGEEHPDTSEALRQLAQGLELVGRLPEAAAAAEQAVRIDRATLPASHPKLAVDLKTLARARVLAGDDDGAIAAYEEVMRIAAGLAERERHLRKRLTVDAYLGIGGVHLDNGDHAAAASMAERALAASADGSSDDRRRPAVEFLAARALWPDDPARARALATSARDAYVRLGIEPAMVRHIDAWLASTQTAHDP